MALFPEGLVGRADTDADENATSGALSTVV
jgi:hypothetical protein